MVKEYQGMNYETNVDSFMPHRARIIVDHPIHPERVMEEAEMMEEYEKIWRENGF